MLDRVLLACGGTGVDLSKLFVEVLDGSDRVYGSATVDYGSLTSVTLDSGFGSGPSNFLDTARVTLSDGKVHSVTATSETGTTKSAELRFTAGGVSVGLAFSGYCMPSGMPIPGMEYKWETRVGKL